MLTVACVLTASAEYGPAQVQALHRAVSRHWPKGQALRFVVLTDTEVGGAGIEERPLRRLSAHGWWCKMELFEAAQDDLGDILYFDLDTMIVGALGDIVSAPAASNAPVLLRDFYHPIKVQSGMMYLPQKARPEVCAAWLEGPKRIMHTVRGDGEFLDLQWRGKARTWQELLPGQVASYKVDIRQRKGQSLPDNTRVVCFHGKPRPWDSPLWSRFA